MKRGRRWRALLYLLTFATVMALFSSCTGAAGSRGDAESSPTSLSAALIAPDEPPLSPPEVTVTDTATGGIRHLPLAFSEWELEGKVILNEPPPFNLRQAGGPLPIGSGGIELHLGSPARAEYVEVRFFDRDPRREDDGAGDLLEPLATFVCHRPPLPDDDHACPTLFDDSAATKRGMKLPVHDALQFLTVFATWTAASDATLDQYSGAWLAVLEHDRP